MPSIAGSYFFLFEINSEDIGISKLKSQLFPSSQCALGYHLPPTPLKNTRPIFCQALPPLNLQAVQVPLFRQFPHLYQFFVTPCAFHFVEMQSVICIAHYNFLTKFCSSDPSFNRNILTSLYLKSEHLRMRNYATTRLNILYTNFATWCRLETYIEDTIDKWHQQTTS